MKLLVYIVYRYDYIHRIHNKNHYCPVKAGKSVFEIVET